MSTSAIIIVEEEDGTFSAYSEERQVYNDTSRVRVEKFARGLVKFWGSIWNGDKVSLTDLCDSNGSVISGLPPPPIDPIIIPDPLPTMGPAGPAPFTPPIECACPPILLQSRAGDAIGPGFVAGFPNPCQGDSLILLFVMRQATQSLSPPSPWVLISSVTSVGGVAPVKHECWAIIGASQGLQVFNMPGQMAIWAWGILEVAGADTVSPIDQNITNVGTGVTSSTGTTSTLALASEMVFASVATDNNSLQSNWRNGFVMCADPHPNFGLQVASRAAFDDTAKETGSNLSASDQWSAILVSVK